jgi:AcrR family transcriptional regulator
MTGAESPPDLRPQPLGSAGPGSATADDGGSSAERAAGPFALRPEDVRPFALSRLPFGRHGLPRQFVEENHRDRLIAGALDSLAERGYPATTVAHIIGAAAVSNSTFYGHYPGKEDCVLVAYRASAAWLEAEVAVASSPIEDWAGRVSRAVAVTLALLDSDQRLARLLAVEIFATGPRGRAVHRETVDRLGLPLRVGRGERALGAGLPIHLEAALIGGAISLIGQSLEDGGALTSLASELTEYLLAPYLGVEAARRVAAVGDSDPSSAGHADVG